MKIIHLSDFHLGKNVNGFLMLDDQRYILDEIIKIIDLETPDAIIIAGDIYDRSVPPAEAVALFDEFLKRISKREIETFVIAGNHDSAERIAFASSLIDKSGIHFSPVYDGKIRRFSLNDEHGEVNFYMLPFVKPLTVTEVFPEEKENVKSYTDALRLAISKMEVDETKRNVLVAHQFVTGAVRSDSEEKSLGGMDNVDAEVFDKFDYVALGHIHRPQKITEKIRYSGSILKYSFSEIKFDKSALVVEMDEKGKMKPREVPLTPKRDMKELKGSYMELTDKKFYDGINREDYFHIILTDEEDVLDAIDRLRVIYPNVMALDYDNKRTRSAEKVLADVRVDDMLPLELFADFYKKQNGQEISDAQREYLDAMIKEIWEKKQ